MPSSFQVCHTPLRCATTVVGWLASSTSNPILLALETMAYSRLERPRTTQTASVKNVPWTSCTVGRRKSVTMVRAPKCMPGAESITKWVSFCPRKSACVLRTGAGDFGRNHSWSLGPGSARQHSAARPLAARGCPEAIASWPAGLGTCLPKCVGKAKRARACACLGGGCGAELSAGTMHGGRDALDALVGLASVREDQVGVAVRAGVNARAFEAVRVSPGVGFAFGRQVFWYWGNRSCCVCWWNRWTKGSMKTLCRDHSGSRAARAGFRLGRCLPQTYERGAGGFMRERRQVRGARFP